MQNRFGLVALIILVATAFFRFNRTEYMSSNTEQPQVVQEDTTPQQQEQTKPELASKVASSGPRLPIPLPNPEDLVKAQGKPGRTRITQPVEPPVES